MPKKLLHFDSLFSTNLKSSTVTYGSPYYTQYAITNPIKKIKKISLKSVELPIGFTSSRLFNSTQVYGEVSMTMKINGTTYSAFLQPTSTYTTLSALLTDLNTAWALVGTLNGIASLVPVFSQYSNSAFGTRVQFYSTATTALVLNQTTALPTYLLTKLILGFDATETASAGTTIARNPINLFPDLYCNMVLDNVPTDANNTSQIPSTFKIPLLAPYSAINNYTESQMYKQYVEITDPNFTLSSLIVKITDRLGNSLDGGFGSLDYSFTLEFEYLD